MLKPLRVNEEGFNGIEPPRFERANVMLLAGIGARYNCSTSWGIPAQWQRFLPQLGHIPGKSARPHSVRAGTLTTTEISITSAAPPWPIFPGFRPTGLISASRRNATPRSPIANTSPPSAVPGTRFGITGCPESGYEVVDAPDFERYGEEFDSNTGTGGFEIWVQVQSLSGQEAR